MISERIRGARHMYWSALLITGVVLLIVISLLRWNVNGCI